MVCPFEKATYFTRSLRNRAFKSVKINDSHGKGSFRTVPSEESIPRVSRGSSSWIHPSTQLLIWRWKSKISRYRELPSDCNTICQWDCIPGFLCAQSVLDDFIQLLDWWINTSSIRFLGMGNNSCLQGRLGHDGRRPSILSQLGEWLIYHWDLYGDATLLGPEWFVLKYQLFLYDDWSRRLDCPRRSTLRISNYLHAIYWPLLLPSYSFGRRKPQKCSSISAIY